MNHVIIPQDFIIDNNGYLDTKKPQTTYKIKYVSQYIQNWLHVVTNIPEVQNINFVDCMCNAGIYRDGEVGTSIKVLQCFNEIAKEHPDKSFNLVLNDINSKRLEIIQQLIDAYIGIASSNIHIIVSQEDVNQLLLNDLFFNQLFNCYPRRSANVVFVDPYNFCTVRISSLRYFLSKYYCELIFNVFTNDFVRNQDKQKMQRFCQSENIKLGTKDEMIAFITSQLKVGHIKYSFSYEFKIIKNVELYQIMFFTPSLRGLEKLKDALWGTFNGKDFYKTENSTCDQLSLFSEEDEKAAMLSYHSSKAKDLLLENLSGEILDYSAIEEFIIENTILSGTQVIKNVLKPLIQNGSIVKLGLVSNASNYKNDQYQIGVKNEDH